MQDIRIAVAVTRSIVGQTAHNLATVERWVAAARRKQVQLICFPELSLSGYTTRPEITHLAREIPNTTTAALQGIARETGITILAGMAEKTSDNFTFATHLVVSSLGPLLSYRKLHIAPPEQAVLAAGNRIPLFDADGLRFGIQLCYDAHFPELSVHMALNGAEAIFIPHASPRGNPLDKYTSWMRHLTARAYDNSIFIVACNQVGDNGNGLNFPGVALVLNPAGHVIHQYMGSEEHLLVADLKAADLQQVRNSRMGYFLPHRRPELYQSR